VQENVSVFHGCLFLISAKRTLPIPEADWNYLVSWPSSAGIRQEARGQRRGTIAPLLALKIGLISRD
jgi:hypothetical protein